MLRSSFLLAVAFFATAGTVASAQKKTLSLKEIWQEAIENYPSLKSQQAVTKQLEAERDLIKTFRLPEFRFQAQQNYGSSESIPGSFFPLPGNFNTGGPADADDRRSGHTSGFYSSGVLQWDFYQFGRVRKQISAAGAAVKTGQAMVTEEIFALKMHTARLYFKALEQTALLRVMEEEERRYSGLLSFISAQAAAGLIPGADSFLLRSSLLSVQAEKQDFIAARLSVLKQLSAFIGKPEADFVLDTGMFFNPVRKAMFSDIGDHPVLQKLKRMIEYSRALLQEEQSLVYPSLSLLAGAGIKNSNFSQTGGFREFSRAWKEPSGFYLGGIGLTWDLSSLYEAPFRKKKAAQRTEEFMADYEAEKLKLQAAYNTALENEQHNQAKRMQSREALRLSKEAFERYRSRYENGLIDMISLLQLQKSVQEAEIRYVKSVYGYWSELLRSAGATGRAELLADFMGF